MTSEDKMKNAPWFHASCSSERRVSSRSSCDGRGRRVDGVLRGPSPSPTAAPRYHSCHCAL
ncbi:hypothetical protein EYF80_056994 [Liparis tanakae]|uniref:Uncharacterized protein n=1 Tax=Liparis tanakae TaxID=230148 RepID=A0A4Z2EVM5_9TELE|nr:hypothetical protein EYF80_056994 [Liparis tanakae]